MESNGAVDGAVAMWVRADWRRRRGAVVGLVLLAGLAGGVVLVALAGARRTATSFERLASESRSADVVVDVGALDVGVADEIARLPMVDVSGAYTLVFALVDGVDTDLAIWIPRDSRVGAQLEADRVIRGRRPDPSRSDEVAVNESTAELLGVDIGDHVSIATMTPEQVKAEKYFPPNGPNLLVEVVGVVRRPDELVSSGEGGFMASQAMFETVHGRADEWTTYLGVRLKPTATTADFEAAVRKVVPPGQEYETLLFEVRSKAARETISAIASGMAVFAIVAALAAVVAVGQAVGRHVLNAKGDQDVLSELGVTRAGRRGALVLRILPVAIGGAVVAAGVAWLASPIMPVGLARRAEPDPGLSADWAVLALGGLAIAVVVVVLATVSAIWLTRDRRKSRTRSGPNVVGTAFSRADAGPVAGIGVSLALDRGPPLLPLRSAIAGVAAATLGIVGVLTFSASLDRLLATPTRWGYGWDLLLNFNSRDIDAASPRVVADDRLSAVARWDAGFSFVNGQSVRAYGLSPLLGDLGFSLRSGRQPVTAGEIVLGPDTADRLGVRLGDRVAVAPQSDGADRESVTVVGIALFPDDRAGSFTNAVGYVGEAFERHAIAPDLFEAFQLVVRVAPGHDIDELAMSLDEQYPGSASSGENLPVQPDRVANLAGIRSLPGWLAAFVALLGVASLGNVLLTTLRRRRVQLATLRSLGLTSHQIVSCMVCQSATITILGLAIGVPLGIVAGNTSWFVVVDPIGVATDSSHSFVAVCAVSLAALFVAVLVALGPGRHAARLRPAQALRVE